MHLKDIAFLSFKWMNKYMMHMFAHTHTIPIGECSNFKSTVKWTTPDPCLVFSENKSKLYTDFEYCEQKNHKNSKNMLICKAKHSRMTKKIQEKVYISEDGTSGT